MKKALGWVLIAAGIVIGAAAFNPMVDFKGRDRMASAAYREGLIIGRAISLIVGAVPIGIGVYLLRTKRS